MWRVLVTGSRTWTDTRVLREGLAAVWHPEAVLVHGACGQGVDLLAEQCWTHWGGRVERWPADWHEPCTPDCPPDHRRGSGPSSTCPRAGLRRNLAMINSDPDVCLAFIRDQSRGATHCAEAAERAGIRTITATHPDEAPTHCRECGQLLLYRRVGRTHCQRCQDPESAAAELHEPYRPE